ncbi:endolytic transglycosylase MltG [Microcella daejeonensis]|uniref:Endolytic murein transglycosylase n=1 Tax=Microcella daejeonensis TaxID=2994971 RepID=A0A9E8S8R4_9MICO|nr:endolytic transglycosylase MltG [Microcella daejeonensis]WAB81184.1 endolytic transglycosylase MltG [Microcella daejeonensis]
MSDDDAWDAIFRSQPDTARTEQGSAAPGSSTGSPAGAPVGGPAAAEPPVTRAALRERGAAAPDRRSARQILDEGRPPRRRRVWPWVLGVLLLLGGLGAGAVAYAWANYEPQLREALGWELPNDYEGTGNGTEVLVTITPGEIGSDIATTLQEQGVTMTYDAFYDLLLADPSIAFQPGTYALQEEMSAQSALDALLDPANRRESTATIREGLRAGQVIDILSAATGVPLADYEAAIADLAALGLPPEAPTVEGYLFPATYTFEPGTPAIDQVRRLVDETFARLDARGVAAEDRHRVLTIASLVQSEARLPEDFYRVSRVIQNRLDDGWRLEFDSTAQYGSAQADGSVFSTQETLEADNPYNTYVIEGLPIGPIGNPGDLAVEAALAPAEGPWLFFVTVNLDSGETVFSETVAQHEEGVAQLRRWCSENPGNSACG